MKTIDSTDPSLASLPSVQASVNASVEDDDDRLDRIRLLKEYAREFAAECDNDVFAQAATNIAIVDLYSILNRFDTAKLSKRLEKNPELYFKLIKSFCEFSRLGLERDKFEWKKKQVEERKLARNRKLRARKPILINLATIAPAMLSIATLCEGSAQSEAPVPTESNAASPEPSVGPRVGIHALACRPQTVTSDTALTETIEFAETLSRPRQPIPPAVRSQPNDCQMDSPHRYIEELPERAMGSAPLATFSP